MLIVCLGALFAFSTGESKSAEDHRPRTFDYYVLVLSWTPAYCRGPGRDRHEAQCDTTKPFGFAVHGLWPEYGGGWPLHCWTDKQPWIPDSLIKEMSDVMPSKGLMIHEYRVHGTCSGLNPNQYFELTRKFYEQVTIPARFLSPKTEETLSPGAIEQAFSEANSWLKPDMMAVMCQSGKLVDVRFCFSRDLKPRDCGDTQQNLCPDAQIVVPTHLPR